MGDMWVWVSVDDKNAAPSRVQMRECDFCAALLLVDTYAEHVCPGIGEG